MYNGWENGEEEWGEYEGFIESLAGEFWLAQMHSVYNQSLGKVRVMPHYRILYRVISHEIEADVEADSPDDAKLKVERSVFGRLAREEGVFDVEFDRVLEL